MSNPDKGKYTQSDQEPVRPRANLWQRAEDREGEVRDEVEKGGLNAKLNSSHG